MAVHMLGKPLTPTPIYRMFGNHLAGGNADFEHTTGLVERVWDGSQAHAGHYEGEMGKKNMSGPFTCQRNASPSNVCRRILSAVGHGRPSEEYTTKGKVGEQF